MYKWTFLKSVLISLALTFSAFSYADNHQLDINKASAVQLATQLSGVGAKKAKAIVAYREELGGFTDLEQLKDVKGIGNSIFSKNRDRLMLSAPVDSKSGSKAESES